MNRKAFFAALVVAASLSFGLSAAYGADAGNEKVGVFQKMKNAYNNFRNRQQQKPQTVKNETSKVTPMQNPVEAQKVTANKASPAKAESAKAGSPAGKAEKKGRSVEDMSKEEILADLKSDLEDPAELMGVVPELKSSTDQSGKTVLTFKGAALDKLSKEDLSGLYIRVRQNITRIRTERIERQLETVRRVERLQKVSAPSQPAQALPVVPSAPRAPSAPSAAPSVPRAQSVPSAPPAPPSAPQRR